MLLYRETTINNAGKDNKEGMSRTSFFEKSANGFAVLDVIDWKILSTLQENALKQVNPAGYMGIPALRLPVAGEVGARGKLAEFAVSAQPKEAVIAVCPPLDWNAS